MTARLLTGALVADGIGTTTRRADILIDDDAIAHVGPNLAVGDDTDVIELPAGSVICPGFIDAHAHAEMPLLRDGRVDGALAQGVTTLVVGQDGTSLIGASQSTVEYLNQYFAAVNATVEPARPFDLAAFKATVDGRLGQNVAVLASQGTIRHNIAGAVARPLEPAELAEALRQVEQALEQGAVGLSSGLEYVPSRFADVDELSALAAALAGTGRPYVSHLRAYGPAVAPAFHELITVGGRAGVPVHASHLWAGVEDIEAAYRQAERAGVALSHDMYPYRRSSTILAMLLLPAAVQEGGPAATLARLRDADTRAALLREPTFTEQFLDQVMLGTVPEDLGRSAGLSITEAAAIDGARAGEWALDLLVAGELRVGGHLDRPTFDQDQMDWIIDHPGHAVGSDGIYQGQHPHPRGFGTFARLAEHYLGAGPERGYQLLAQHAAARAADIYGLTSRGRIAPGLAADLVVIAPDGLHPRATDEAPKLAATGVALVLVNGTPVYRDGAPLPAAPTPGRLISR